MDKKINNLSTCQLRTRQPYDSCQLKKIHQVVIAVGSHLFPFRTEKLSPLAPMVLQCNAGEQVAASFLSERSFEQSNGRFFCLYSLRVCYFRAWRKSFPEWFVISALGESCFLNGLAFPRMAKVISRKVCAYGAPATHFLRVLTLRYKAKFNQQKNF